MLYLAESLSGQCAYSLIYIHVYIQDSLSCTVKFDKSPPHQRHVLLSQWTNGRLRPLCSHLSGCPSLRLSPLSEIYDSISSRACHCSQRCSVITSCRTTAKHLLMHACGANAMCVCLSHVNMRFRPHPSIQAKGGGGDKHVFISNSMCYSWKPADKLFFFSPASSSFYSAYSILLGSGSQHSSAFQAALSTCSIMSLPYHYTIEDVQKCAGFSSLYFYSHFIFHLITRCRTIRLFKLCWVHAAQQMKLCAQRQAIMYAGGRQKYKEKGKCKKVETTVCHCMW